MNNRNLVVYTFISLFVFLLFSNFFTVSGFLVKDNEKLIISLDIPPDQQKIKAGENLFLEVVIREFGGTISETTPININYEIKDLEDNLVSSKQELGAIAVKQSEITNLLIPTNTKPGVYVASVSVEYDGNVYTGTKTFEVTSPDKRLNVSLETILVVAILIRKIFVSQKKRKKYKKRKRR